MRPTNPLHHNPPKTEPVAYINKNGELFCSSHVPEWVKRHITPVFAGEAVYHEAGSTCAVCGATIL